MSVKTSDKEEAEIIQITGDLGDLLIGFDEKNMVVRLAMVEAGGGRRGRRWVGIALDYGHAKLLAKVLADFMERMAKAKVERYEQKGDVQGKETWMQELDRIVKAKEVLFPRTISLEG
jgi:hypothetical protein